MGGSITHSCSLSRSIGWFLEGILPLAPFCKRELQLQLSGVTNDHLDMSVDTLNLVTLPFLRNFGINGASIKVKRRGSPPKGGGFVEFFCPLVRETQPLFTTDNGLVKRVRGIGYCSRISPTIITRVISSAREVFHGLLPDVHIDTNHFKGAEGGQSPGYSLCLVAETTTGALISAERTAVPNTGVADLPETIGEECALLLLEEIRRGYFSYKL
jgi:RNA 3'-terminal phosphate cyclase-like protein